jgi:prepilin-type N-terminal cleavage/methylation domain-containing protein
LRNTRKEREQMGMKGITEEQRERGFTLVELLIAVVVVGVLMAVATVGTDGVVDRGHNSACQASADAAKAASAIFYANSAMTAFPTDFHDLIASNNVYDIPTGVTPTAPAAGDKVLTGRGWTLRISGGGATVPVFTCG